MTDKIIELLEKLLEEQEQYYKTLPSGYEQAKAKGKRDGLEMALFRVTDLIQRNECGE